MLSPRRDLPTAKLSRVLARREPTANLRGIARWTVAPDQTFGGRDQGSPAMPDPTVRVADADSQRGQRLAFDIKAVVSPYPVPT